MKKFVSVLIFLLLVSTSFAQVDSLQNPQESEEPTRGGDFYCSGAVVNGSIATVTLCADDYDPITALLDHPTSFGFTLPTGQQYEFDGYVSLENVQCVDSLVIREVDANGNTVVRIAKYNALGVNNTTVNFPYQPTTGRFMFDIYCYYGAVNSNSGFQFTISPLNQTEIGYACATYLGVGTCSPQKPLHVNGELRISDPQNSSKYLDISPSNNSFYNSSSQPFRFNNKVISTNGFYSNNSNLTLGTNSTPQITILNNTGYVGIGTTTPESKLHVDGGIKIGNGTSLTERFLNVLKFGNSNNVKIGEFDADDMLSFTASKYCFNSGYVGINTKTAAYPLDVNGKVFLHNYDSEQGWANSYLYWQGHSLVMGTPPGAAAHNSLDLKPGGTTDIPDALFSRLRMYTATSTNVQIQKIELQTESNCWFMNEGNFGIGTSSPTHKLDVRGTIRANEILVNIPSGADFVFDKGYQLMPLEDLSEYVQQNKHLPEVKPATEMEQDGVTMGEMQIKLLQKVEELTLYILQQQAEIEILKQQIEKLKK